MSDRSKERSGRRVPTGTSNEQKEDDGTDLALFINDGQPETDESRKQDKEEILKGPWFKAKSA